MPSPVDASHSAWGVLPCDPEAGVSAEGTPETHLLGHGGKRASHVWGFGILRRHQLAYLFLRPHNTGHKEILTRELEAVGIRLNQKPPEVYFVKKKTVMSSSLVLSLQFAALSRPAPSLAHRWICRPRVNAGRRPFLLDCDAS